MASPLRIQYALMCLQELDRQGAGFLDARNISRSGGIPPEDCREILTQLHDAGILETRDGRTFALQQPLDSLTALQIMQAVGTTLPKKAPAFRMLMSLAHGVLRKTLEAVGSTPGGGPWSNAGAWN